MSGVAVIRHVLANNGALTAVVPSTRIIAGVIPLPAPQLPAISITEVSAVPRNTVAMAEAKRLQSERVQVTAVSRSYPQQKQIIGLVRKACANQRGTINGVEVDSIMFDSVGPDFADDTGILTQSLDVFVRWHASA